MALVVPPDVSAAASSSTAGESSSSSAARDGDDYFDLLRPSRTSAPARPTGKDDEALLALALKVLRDLRLPADLAGNDPKVLTRPLTDVGCTKLGERLRITALLHRHRVSHPVPMVGPASAFGAAPATPGGIPRRLFTYWHDQAPPELVRCCISLMRQRNTGWELRVIHPGCTDLPAPPVPLESLMGSHQADWYRLAALAEYGGVYLDSTCVTLQPLEEWVEVSCGAVQGFLFVPDGETMESWAIAAPRGSAFVREWFTEFGRALRVGVKSYCHSLPPGVVSAGLRPSLEDGYLAIHAAWRVVRARQPATAFRLHAATELGRPYRYLAECLWQSAPAVEALFGKTAEELAHTPLIKLRGFEREATRPLRLYGASSHLARTLLSATVPRTVTERLAFLACGLDLPD